MDIIGFLDALHIVLGTALLVVSVLFGRIRREQADQGRRIEAMQQQILTVAGLSPPAQEETEQLEPSSSDEEYPDWLPPAGWMRHPEAVRLAREYVLAVPGVRRGEAASLVVAEFLDNHPKHHNPDRRFVERIPLEAWLLTHRLPLPQRARWRNLAIGIGLNEHGELMAYDPTKPHDDLGGVQPRNR